MISDAEIIKEEDDNSESLSSSSMGSEDLSDDSGSETTEAA